MLRIQIWVQCALATSILWHFAAAQPQDPEAVAYLGGRGPLYHTASQLEGMLVKLAQTNSTYISTRKLEAGGRSLAAALSSLPPAPDQPARPLALITCGIHAREVLASELCYWLVRALAGDVDTVASWPETQRALASTRPFATPTGSSSRSSRRSSRSSSSKVSPAALRSWVNSIRQRLDVLLVPNANPSGRAAVEAGAFGQRKNAAGVDLNRNFPLGYSNSSSDNSADPGGEEYRGRGPLSEWETRALFNAAMSLRPAAFIDIHTGMESIMSLWGHKYSLADIPDDVITAWEGLLAALNQPLRVAASPGSSQLYLTPGSVENTMYGLVGAAYSVTVEVYGEDDEGRDWTCPRLSAFKAACTEANQCGTTNCRRADGSLVGGSSRRRRRARALLGDQQQAADSSSSRPTQAQSAAVSNGGVAKRQVVPSAPPRPMRVGNSSSRQATPTPATSAAVRKTRSSAPRAARLPGSDPFLRRIQQDSCTGCTEFLFFNPTSADRYREAIGRWLVALLAGLDHVGTTLRA